MRRRDRRDRRRLVLEDGREVEPYTLHGYYDAGGNYIPGYYDEEGNYHLGYGYWDAQGQWRVAFGYYDPSGEWVATEEPVRSVETSGEAEADASPPIWETTSDRETYTDAFFDDRGGDTLEIAHLWGDHLLSVTTFEEARDITMGPEGGEDFRVGEATVDPETPLLVYDGQWMLAVTGQMRGRIRRGNEEYGLEAWIASDAARRSTRWPDRYLIPIGPQTSARIEVGGHTFVIHFTSMPTVAGNALQFERAGIGYQLTSAIAHALVLLFAMTLPGRAAELSLQQYQDRDRFIGTVLKPDQKKEKKTPDWMKHGGDEEGAKHRAEETKAGAEESEQTDRQMRIEGPPDNEETEVKKSRDEQVAMSAGVMGALQQREVASTFGSADRAVGSDARDAIGNLDAAEPGHAKGFGGLGLTGDGRGGGGGVSEEGVGIGEVDTGGHGAGCGGPGGCDGAPFGEGAAEIGDNPETTPDVVPGDPDVCSKPGGEGASCPLSKEIIRRVVRQHRREIRYCYEKELQANPGLEGRVVIDFTISPTGGVVSALVGESTLNNPAVQRCMQSKIRRWTFPIDDGKRLYEIRYPFDFTSAAK